MIFETLTAHQALHLALYVEHLIAFSPQPLEVRTFVFSMLQMMKLGPRKGKQRASGHRANKQQSQDLNPQLSRCILATMAHSCIPHELGACCMPAPRPWGSPRLEACRSSEFFSGCHCGLKGGSVFPRWEVLRSAGPVFPFSPS